MTELLVTPIDLSAGGSYRERQRFMRLIRSLRKSQEDKDIDAILDVFDQVDDIVVKHLKTDDGSPIEDALDKLSAKQFDELLAAITFEDSVPPANASSSETPSPKAKKRRNG